MSYSNLMGAVALAVGLSACAQGVSVHESTAVSRFLSSADTSNVSITGKRAQFVAGGEVIVEHRSCDVWSTEAADQCDLSVLASESMGHQGF